MHTIAAFSQCQSLEKYISNIKSMNESTARSYNFRLNNFSSFILAKYNVGLDDIIKQIKGDSQDPYDTLIEYVSYLRNNFPFSTLTVKQYVVTVKNFLEYYDVDISPRKFKLKVKMPKVTRKNKEALSKEDVVNILNACSNIRLKTYVMLLAGTGCRAVEALSIRIKELNLESNPARIFVRGEITKTKVDRYVFLTDEMVSQLKTWLDYKCRRRRVCSKDSKTGKTIAEYRQPINKSEDLVFGVHQSNPSPINVYTELRNVFAKTLDRIGMGSREDSVFVISSNHRTNNNSKENSINKKKYYGRRHITLHSFRRFVKTTISDLGTVI
jgi:integrase